MECTPFHPIKQNSNALCAMHNPLFSARIWQVARDKQSSSRDPLNRLLSAISNLIVANNVHVILVRCICFCWKTVLSRSRAIDDQNTKLTFYKLRLSQQLRSYDWLENQPKLIRDKLLVLWIDPLDWPSKDPPLWNVISNEIRIT